MRVRTGTTYYLRHLCVQCYTNRIDFIRVQTIFIASAAASADVGWLNNLLINPFDSCNRLCCVCQAVLLISLLLGNKLASNTSSQTNTHTSVFFECQKIIDALSHLQPVNEFQEQSLSMSNWFQSCSLFTLSLTTVWVTVRMFSLLLSQDFYHSEIFLCAKFSSFFTLLAFAFKAFFFQSAKPFGKQLFIYLNSYKIMESNAATNWNVIEYFISKQKKNANWLTFIHCLIWFGFITSAHKIVRVCE